MNRPPLQYERVKNHILAGIEQGKWSSGTMIPSENELAKNLSTSRMTANRAIKELTSDGVLSRIQGKGTFVAEPRPLQSVLQILGIDEEILERGNEYSCRVVHVKTVKANAEIAGKLNLPAGSKLFSSLIIHFENNIPVQLEERWVNPVIAPKYGRQKFEDVTPHHYLSGIAPFTSGQHTIEAIIPDSKHRRQLKMESGEPCLMIHRRTWVNQTVASYVRLLHPGNRYQITTGMSNKSG